MSKQEGPQGLEGGSSGTQAIVCVSNLSSLRDRVRREAPQSVTREDDDLMLDVIQHMRELAEGRASQDGHHKLVQVAGVTKRVISGNEVDSPRRRVGRPKGSTCAKKRRTAPA
jgi:hypothetical protein